MVLESLVSRPLWRQSWIAGMAESLIPRDILTTNYLVNTLPSFVHTSLKMVARYFFFIYPLLNISGSTIIWITGVLLLYFSVLSISVCSFSFPHLSSPINHSFDFLLIHFLLFVYMYQFDPSGFHLSKIQMSNHYHY